MKVGISKKAAICAIILLFVSICSLNASASDLPVYSGWAKEEVSAAEDMRLLPFAMYDDCRRALHRDWAAAFLVRFVETVMNSPIESRGVQLFDDVPIGRPNFEDINKAYTIGVTKGVGDGTNLSHTGILHVRNMLQCFTERWTILRTKLGKISFVTLILQYHLWTEMALQTGQLSLLEYSQV